jgi:DNA polymerase
MNLAALIDFEHGPPMDVISSVLRGFIIPAEGHDLLVADFSAIEARGLAWLAGEEKVLQAFRNDEDLYCLAAQDIYGHKVTKKEHPDKRQVGKVVVLACGYQGSVGAFQAMAKGYGVKVEDKEALKIVKAWRAANENIVSYWKECEDAAITAVQNPNTKVPAGPAGRQVTYMKRGSFLWCRLPSGRTLSYPYPKLVPYVWMEKVSVGEDGEEQRESKRVPVGEKSRWWAKGWETNGAESPALHYRYMDTVSGWTEGPTYGGSLVENITQAVCRDILAEAIVRLEARGYPVVFHVHDEAVCEVPEGFGSADEMCAIMSEVPAWATDFPIAAAGFRTKRYRKDD